MARPREFDRDRALACATDVFWAKGYASTSTEDLLAAMGIGRQSLYNAFGDKRALYLEALERYQRATTSGHLQRLRAPASPLAGIEALLLGLIAEDDGRRAMGCMGVGAVSEFGAGDRAMTELRAKVGPPVFAGLIERLREGQANGEIDPGMDAEAAAGFIQMTMTGLQLAARAGAGAEALRALARFAVDRLKTR
ncbi:MAG TPA: TetR/AcrR family transcriptional regulator [Caulobacteraceae bacterium]|jgi:AcrR family transcriptional regulator|nr:TetR/AcrR family transcriptional regulator [Caulobacteraceae bacterium]